MKSAILGLLAETAIHPGSGQDTGFVDLPVAREASTNYPVIVGSSFKGALRSAARERKAALSAEALKKVFGEQDDAGALLPSDARLLLLPARSMRTQYKWITCPHILERYQRDLLRAGLAAEAVPFNGPPKESYLTANPEETGELFLEERQLQHGGKVADGLVEHIGRCILHDATRNRLPQQLVVLHDDDFAWFASYGLAINARNNLDEVKKTSKNLWYEETIPADSVFYAVLGERVPGAVGDAVNLFNGNPYLQIGGNMTVGQGWFAVAVINGVEG